MSREASFKDKVSSNENILQPKLFVRLHAPFAMSKRGYRQNRTVESTRKERKRTLIV